MKVGHLLTSFMPHKREKGPDYVEGRRPYGWTTDEAGKLVEIPEEQETIRLIRKLRRKRPGPRQWGTRRIANELNEREIPARDGGRWHHISVQNVLGRRTGR